jgi:hypothetical protein
MNHIYSAILFVSVAFLAPSYATMEQAMHSSFLREVAKQRIATIESQIEKIPAKFIAREARLEKHEYFFEKYNCSELIAPYRNREIAFMAANKKYKPEFQDYDREITIWSKLSGSQRIVTCFTLAGIVRKSRRLIAALNRSRDRLGFLHGFYQQTADKLNHLVEVPENVLELLNTAEQYERYLRSCKLIKQILETFLRQAGIDRPDMESVDSIVWSVEHAKDILSELMQDVIEERSESHSIYLFLWQWLSQKPKGINKDRMKIMAGELLSQFEKETALLADKLLNLENAII